MSLRFSVLSSGSAGNAIFVETDESAILIDAGLSPGKIDELLHKIGRRHSVIEAVLLTHGHGDHASGAHKICERWLIPIYRPTPGAALDFPSLMVNAFELAHDGGGVGFEIMSEDHRGMRTLGVALDTGCVTRQMADAMKQCQAIIIGCDYDPALLEASDYDEALKRRIASNTGHLSNLQIEEFFREEWDGTAHTIVLAHLSEQNNSPELATAAAVRGMDKNPAFHFSQIGSESNPKVIVSLPMMPTEMVEV